MRQALAEAQKLLSGQNAPRAMRNIFKEFRELTNESDPYEDFKQETIKITLKILPELREEVNNSARPLVRALELGTAANTVDLARTETDEIYGQLQSLPDLDEFSFARGKLENLVQELNSATSVFLIGDKAGEVVFDLLLLEQLGEKELYYGVRGAPVLNDATEVEALETGIYRWAEIVSSGSTIPGTILEEATDEFNEMFETADIVLAKGQGNFESLEQPSRPVYHLFKTKCKPVAQVVDCEIGEFVLHRREP